MVEAAPLPTYTGSVLPEWCDYNDHLNVAYYGLVFDRATDGLLDHLGIGAAYRALANASVFAVENHVVYRQELRVHAAIAVTTQLLGTDLRRLHFFHRLWRTLDGEIAATCELMGVHVDMATRRASPWPEPARASIAALAQAHTALPVPPEAGRAIRPLTAGDWTAGDWTAGTGRDSD